MITTTKPEDGDVLLSGSRGVLGPVIRRFLREKNDPAPFNHVGVLALIDAKRAAYIVACGAKLPRSVKEKVLATPQAAVPCVIEALWRVAITPLDKYLQGGDRLALARHRGLTPTQCTKIADAALEHVGRSYSVSKLLAFGMDRLLGCNLSASMGPDELVCSSLLARAYAKVGIHFEGKANPRGVTPDDVWDEVKKSKPWWVWWERE